MKGILLALLGSAAVLSLPACAPAGYTDAEFEEVLRAYLEIARNDDSDAAETLLRLGEQAGDVELLRDATYAAVNQRDIELAKRAGEAWYAAGGEDALLLLARIHVGTSGLASASGMLSRLAEEGGAAAVYQVALTAADSWAERIDAFRAAHPLHLRNDEYYAYRALLYIEAGFNDEARQTLNEGLVASPASVKLLIVALLMAELGDEDANSIELATQLAVAADVDVSVAVIIYSQWAAVPATQRELLPDIMEFTPDTDFPDLALLYAGRFYLQHDEPLTTVEILQQIDVHAPRRPDAIRLLVAAYQQLGDGYVDTTLGLLRREIDRAPVELVPELAELYAQTVEKRDGPLQAFEFLDGLKRAVDNPDLLFMKSVYAERADMLEFAEQALRRLIEVDPQSSIGYNALGYMFADHNIRLGEAHLLITKALEIEPDSSAIIDSFGWVLYRLGDPVGALHYLEDSIRRMGDRPHPEVLAHLVEVLWELGEYERASLTLQAALAIDANDPSVQKVIEKYQLQDVIN